jgi:hypothetical protein
MNDDRLIKAIRLATISISGSAFSRSAFTSRRSTTPTKWVRSADLKWQGSSGGGGRLPRRPRPKA